MKMKLFFIVIVAGILLSFPAFSVAQKAKVKKTTNQTKKLPKKASSKVSSVEAKTTKVEWQKFTSQEGQFSVSFPGKPELEQQINRTSIGNPTSYIYTVAEDSGNVVYGIVAQTSYPDWNLQDDSEIRNFQILQNNFASGNVANISVSGRPGVEWTTQTPNGFPDGWFQYGRAYRDMRTRRLYALVVTVRGLDRTKKFAKNADKFIGSFKIF
ncbi:MAG: hypothetical protein M3Q33_05570 [Acidobacteriota bacterium]|nr:hypothetical protein [Acidobacteriota bacterium]